MSNRCIICDSSAAVEHFPGISRCCDCGYIYANLDMTQEEFETLYADGYFNGEEYSNYVADKEIIQRNFSARLKVLEQYIENDRHRRILEIGCAFGFFLELANRRFPEAVGIDITDAGIEHAKNTLGLNALRSDLLDWDFDQRPIDVACMWDTIEHLRAPDKYLERIASHMESGGLVAITTGDIDSTVARVRKQNWRMIHPPTHAHYFSLKSLTELLNRYGFDVVYAEHPGSYRSVDLVAYNLLILRWNLPQVYNWMRKLGLIRWSLYANLFDIMYVIARRR